MPWDFPTNSDTGEDADTGIVAIHTALLPTSPEGDILCFGDWAGSGP